MGACGSNMSAEEKKEAERNKQLDKMARQEFEAEKQKVKLLLLGAGESGKSTIFKQMKILYGEKSSKEERQQLRSVIWGNMVSNLKEVCNASARFTPHSVPDAVKVLDDIDETDEITMTSELADALAAIWADDGVQETWHHRADFQVQDATAVYCNEMGRICDPNFLPSDHDILYARVRTSGIVEEVYTIDSVKFVMYDVGGQRNERKKWIHCFDQVTAVIFVAAISEYDQVLYEDNKTNRIEEALVLFEEICNSKWFKATSMILFLNKKDLFREKLTEFPFRVDDGPRPRNVDYMGPQNVPGTPSAQEGTSEFEEVWEATTKYVLDNFLARNRNKSKQVYHHVTCATDTDNVNVVFSSCKDTILRDNLKSGGFLHDDY